ncbi:MAG: Ig-like domain-containing protein, partial [Bacteroidia bacterium]|nr:Ig-like domain-containing protein [Bacteroidia bacterium]
IKVGNCGDIIWQKKIDSVGGDGSSPSNQNLFGVDIINRVNGDLLLSTYNFDQYANPSKNNVPAYPGIHLYNVNTNGDVLWHKKMNDSVNSYNLNKMEEISANSYLLIGRKNKEAYYLLVDTLANIIKQNSFKADSAKTGAILNINLNADRTITLLGINSNIPFIKTIDSVGNILDEKTILTPPNHTNYYIDFKHNNSGIIVNSYIDSIQRTYFVNYYSINGILNKQMPSTNFSVIKNGGILVNYLANVNIIYRDSFWIKVDSNFNITASYPIQNPRYNALNIGKRISDNEIGACGRVDFKGGGLSSWRNLMSAKKINLINFVSNITIAGQSVINAKGANIILTANISPASANNKNILWSINDTNIATITQTGLVTAKANGTVLITATAADGGGAKATKAITISNQNVGINEVNLSNQITVYPNPASNFVKITTTKNLTIQQLKLLDITGKIIAQYNNQTEIDLSEIANGMYLLQIQTENGNLVKQVVINK